MIRAPADTTTAQIARSWLDSSWMNYQSKWSKDKLSQVSQVAQHTSSICILGNTGGELLSRRTDPLVHSTACGRAAFVVALVRPVGGLEEFNERKMVKWLWKR